MTSSARLTSRSRSWPVLLEEARRPLRRSGATRGPYGESRTVDEQTAQMRNVRAIVVPGKGTLTTTKPTERPEKRDEIERLTGVGKVPGSLNLRTQEPHWFNRRAGIRWSGGYLFPARIGPIGVVINKQLDRIAVQPSLMHVYAPVRLRDELSLVDGCLVEVEVPEGSFLRYTIIHRCVYRVRLLRRLLAARVVRSKSAGDA